MAYVTALVTFIDVLGFRALVDEDPTGRKVVDVVTKLRSVGIDDLNREDSDRNATALHFSDCVVRFTRLGRRGGLAQRSRGSFARSRGPNLSPG
jgi:hypothetical protein